MDKLRAMAVFVQIAERSSLTKAAQALDLSTPAVVRTLAALESELGVSLARRTTRRVALTDEGAEYLERCRLVLDEVAQADAAMSSRHTQVQGRLVVSAPVQLGRLHVAPLLTELLIRHPALSAELLLFDRRADLIDEGIDIAVRVGHLPDSSLVALRVGEVRRVLCAAPAYLELAPPLRAPGDLAQHRCVRFSGLTPGHEWSFGHGDRVLSVPVNAILVTNQAQAAIDACRRGLGCGVFLSYQVEEDLRANRLQRLLPTYEPPALPVHLVYPQTRMSTRRLRVFIEHVAPGLRAALRATPIAAAATAPPPPPHRTHSPRRAASR